MEYSRLFLVVLSCLCFDPMAMADLETVRAQFQHRNVPGPATSRAFDTVWICGYQPRTRLGDQDRESSHAPLPNNIANGSNGMHRSGWKKTVELRANNTNPQRWLQGVIISYQGPSIRIQRAAGWKKRRERRVTAVTQHPTWPSANTIIFTPLPF